MTLNLASLILTVCFIIMALYQTKPNIYSSIFVLNFLCNSSMKR